MKVAKTKSKNQPNTELQRLAQAENYALFQLQGMLGNLASLNRVPYLNINLLQVAIEGNIDCIKTKQQLRKKPK